MIAREAFRVGWCPGALRPMLSGDGLIVRVKPRGATLSLEQVDGIARAARRHGNGDLDLTSRANLQIRGVTERGLPELTETLLRLDLLDPSAEAEAARNVVSSPLAGIDPAAVLDIRPVVRALESRLVADPALHALPPKFSFVVDDGGRFGLDDVPADVRLTAYRSGRGQRFRVETRRDTLFPEPPCTPQDGVETAVTLALSISHGALDGARRSPDGQSRRNASVVGFHPGDVLGLASPFGRLQADGLRGLASSAAREGASELRLTPWRAVLLPGLDAEAAGRVGRACAASGWILDPGDPRLRVAACPGAPGCRRGTTPVLDHAAVLADILSGQASAGGISLHVSGCGKGCAHRGEAPVTLVGHDGLYDLVLDGGTASDATLRDMGFAEAAAGVRAWAGRERRP